MDAKADLSLCWLHRSYCRFDLALAYIITYTMMKQSFPVALTVLMNEHTWLRLWLMHCRYCTVYVADFIWQTKYKINAVTAADPGWFLRGFDLIILPYFTYWNWQVWANSVDPDQTPQCAASDQGLHWLPLTQQIYTHLHIVKWICWRI